MGRGWAASATGPPLGGEAVSATGPRPCGERDGPATVRRARWGGERDGPAAGRRGGERDGPATVRDCANGPSGAFYHEVVSKTS